jgi:hypothetical protein
VFYSSLTSHSATHSRAQKAEGRSHDGEVV